MVSTRSTSHHAVTITSARAWLPTHPKTLPKPRAQPHPPYESPRTRGRLETSRPVSADLCQHASRLAKTSVPLPRTAAGRTPLLGAEQLGVVYDRMYSRAEELEIKHQSRQREQRRAMREQCTCVRRPEMQRAIVERLHTDVLERRARLQAKMARAERLRAAQKLCNVVALDREAKTKLHEGVSGAGCQWRGGRGSYPLTPTRLVVFGKEVLDLPDDEWDALLARDHRSPQADLWSSAVPKR